MASTKKQYGTPVAVFDISSSSIAGAHVLVGNQKDHLPTILASHRIMLPPQEVLDMKRFVSESVHGLENVLQQLHAADVHHPSVIELALASPWYVSQTRTIVYTKETPFVCTKKLFDRLIADEVQQVVEQELNRFGVFGKDGTVVERQVSRITLNGYTTAAPFGKKTSSVEIALTITVAPKQIIDQFLQVIHRAYGPVQVTTTTSVYASFIVARDYFHAGEECVIVDVGEEVTDIAFAKDNRFLYQHSFPVGIYGLTQLLVEKQQYDIQEATVLLEGYRLNKITASARTKIGKAMGEFTEQWRRALQEVLDQGHFGFCLPEICYITSDVRFETLFSDVIAGDPFIQHTCSRGKVIPFVLDEEKYASFITSLDQELDVPLATTALFLARKLA
ncbi:hypothetical protein IT401_02775 [Candidatus Nomurabacteria bacterium]|nr:hypothetical protein [Candidatus Nomurabacteria bacterium]